MTIMRKHLAFTNGTSLRVGGIKLLQTHNDDTGKHFPGSELGSATRPDEVDDCFNENDIEHALDVKHAQTEVRHIGFVKVHKAASSTMQNMFFRFGMKRGLTFVFTNHPNYFSRVRTSHLPLVKPTKRTGYDIICTHGVFNKSIYSALLPGDTVYLAIVRQPLDLFISSLNYYNQPGLRLDYIARTPGNKLQNLIRHPEVYDKSLFSYTRNLLARDLGFTALVQNDTVAIMNKLNTLGETLKLVMLVEYFDESLVLMKRYLGWTLHDILYISNNVYQKNGYSLKDITPADVEKFKQRNYLDYYVYDFFYKKFWAQFEHETDNIHGEVLHFKRILMKLKTFCNRTTVSDDVMVVGKSTWNEEFRVNEEECTLMKKEELEFIRELRKIQGSELRAFRNPVKRVKKISRLHRGISGH